MKINEILALRQKNNFELVKINKKAEKDANKIWKILFKNMDKSEALDTYDLLTEKQEIPINIRIRILWKILKASLQKINKTPNITTREKQRLLEEAPSQLDIRKQIENKIRATLKLLEKMDKEIGENRFKSTSKTSVDKEIKKKLILAFRERRNKINQELLNIKRPNLDLLNVAFYEGYEYFDCPNRNIANDQCYISHIVTKRIINTFLFQQAK